MKINKNIVDFRPRTVCEVGSGGCRTVLQVENFLDFAEKLIFVEPNSASFKRLQEQNFNGELFINIPKFKLYNAAISNRTGQGKYYNWKPTEENASGFIEDVVSPAMYKDGYVPNEFLMVNFMKFSEIDDGEIDILAVDAEGAEFHVINDMKSRPKIIVLETHTNFAKQSPDFNQINSWMIREGYQSRNDGDDTIYTRN